MRINSYLKLLKI